MGAATQMARMDSQPITAELPWSISQRAPGVRLDISGACGSNGGPAAGRAATQGEAATRYPLTKVIGISSVPLLRLERLRNFGFSGLLYLANHVVSRVPSHHVRLAFYRHAMRFKIGCKSYIFMGAWVDSRRRLEIGRNSVINQHCRLDSRGGITIGDNVSISAEVCILSADHDLQSPEFVGRERPVRIEDHAFIGTRAMILPGVAIGRGAAVAAGAVVTRDVPPYAVVGGVPARVIGSRTRDLRYALDHGRLFF